MNTNEWVLVKLHRPEGYEDVHPELVLEDAHINPAFRPELACAPQPPAEAQAQGGGEVVAFDIERARTLIEYVVGYARSAELKPLSSDACVALRDLHALLHTAPPSAPVGVETLTEQFIAAFAADEAGEGSDPAAGLIGPAVSAWLRSLAQQPAAVVHVPQPEDQAMPDWDAAPPGATHYQPHQGAYYKRVSASEWYVWSRVEDRELLLWLPSPGTSDSAEWVVRPTDSMPPPSAPETEENVAADSYHYLTELLEPYVAREGSNPNGPFPASVVESFQMLLEHWKATQRTPSAPVGVEGLRGAVARGWCADENAHKIVDPVLAEAIVREVAALAQQPAAVDGALSHADMCRLSQVFNAHNNLRVDQDRRINDWLKERIAALAQQPAAPTCRAKPFTPGAKIEWDGSSFLFSGWYFDGGDRPNAPMDFVRAVLSHIEQHCETGQSAKKNLHDVMTPAQQPAAVDGAMERTKWRCGFCGGAYYLPSPSGRFCCDAQAKFRAAQPGGAA